MRTTCSDSGDLLERVNHRRNLCFRREQAEAEAGLCPDAETFDQEAARRVAAVRKAVAGREPAPGDRIRVIGTGRGARRRACPAGAGRLSTFGNRIAAIAWKIME
jgi:hypothetical protein